MESEKIVEAYLRDRMKAIGGIAYKWTSPGNAGVPDRICVFADGRIVFVELKGASGRLSPLQKRQLERLASKNCNTEVLWSRQEVDLFITKYIPKED